jgi:acyl-CoA thioesterase-1
MKPRPSELLLLLAGITACGSEARPSELEAPAREAAARERERAEPSAPVPDVDVPADAPLVVFLGDSVSAGLHVDPKASYPADVQRLLAADAPFRLVNAGVSGDTSAGGLRRLDWLLKQEPDVLVLELGGNDGLRGQPPKEIEARLRQAIERAQAAGVGVLLLGVRLPPSLGPDYVREFADIYPRLAEELHCAYVPFFMEGAASPGGMQADGLHPTRQGHERIAARVAPALRAVLEERARSH